MKRTLKQALALALGTLDGGFRPDGLRCKARSQHPGEPGGAFRAPPPTPTVKR